MNPFLMQIWMVSYEQFLARNLAEGRAPVDAGFYAAQEAEEACKGAQRAANSAKGEASKVVKL